MDRKPIIIYMEGMDHIATDIADASGYETLMVRPGRFPSGEIQVSVFVSVRGRDVVVIPAVSESQTSEFNMTLSEGLMAFNLLLNTLYTSKAGNIVAVLPMLNYARQDRKANGREPLSAGVYISMIEKHVNHMIICDMHSPQLQTMFHTGATMDEVPGDFIATHMLVDLLKDIRKDDRPIVLATPDVGGAKRVESVLKRVANLGDVPGANLIESNPVIVFKQREDGDIKKMTMHQDVAAKHVVFIDDMIDTGGTIMKAADLAKTRGCASVHVIATHGIFSVPFFENFRFCNKSIDGVIVSDTCLPSSKWSSSVSPVVRRTPTTTADGRIKVHSVGKHIAAATMCYINDTSLSERYVIGSTLTTP